MSKCCEYCGVTGNDHISGCPNYKTPFSAYKHTNVSYAEKEFMMVKNI